MQGRGATSRALWQAESHSGDERGGWRGGVVVTMVTVASREGGPPTRGGEEGRAGRDRDLQRLTDGGGE